MRDSFGLIKTAPCVRVPDILAVGTLLPDGFVCHFLSFSIVNRLLFSINTAPITNLFPTYMYHMSKHYRTCVN